MRHLSIILLMALPLAAQTPDYGRTARSGAVVDQTAAARTAPAKTVTALPATCTVGDQVFKTDATAGQNLYGCTGTNAWTLQAGGGGSTAGLVRDFPAALCQSAAGSLAWNTLSADAPTPDCVIGMNGVVYGVAKFSNSTTQAIQQSLDLPTGITSITFNVAWRAAAAGGAVVWQVQYVLSPADGSGADDPALSGGTTVATAAVTAATSTMLKSTLTISPASPGGKRLWFRIFRDPAHASDTFTDATYMPELAKVQVTAQ